MTDVRIFDRARGSFDLSASDPTTFEAVGGIGFGERGRPVVTDNVLRAPPAEPRRVRNGRIRRIEVFFESRMPDASPILIAPAEAHLPSSESSSR